MATALIVIGIAGSAVGWSVVATGNWLKDHFGWKPRPWWLAFSLFMSIAAAIGGGIALVQAYFATQATERERLAAKTTGKLEPAGHWMPGKVPSEAKIQIGNSASYLTWTGPNGAPMLNPKGREIVTIAKNEWEAWKLPGYSYNYSGDALEVVDAYYRPVLQFEVLDTHVRFQAVLPNRSGAIGGLLEERPDEQPSKDPWLPSPTMFRYPREEHLGERALQ